jgi:hypothetical protein
MSTEHSSTNWPPQVFNLTEFATFGQRQSQALTEAQKGWTRLFQKATDDWRARIVLEQKMAAELTGELSAAKNLPDAAAAYQKWIVRHLELMTEDGQKLLDGNQTFVTSMNRLLPKGPGRDTGT